MPSGFPSAVYASWTPTVTAGGSMTVSSLTISQAIYSVNGKIVTISLTLLFTLGGTQSTSVLFTLPLTAALDSNQCFFPANAASNSVGSPGSGWRVYESDATKGVAFLAGVVNWTLGAGASININSTYRLP